MWCKGWKMDVKVTRHGIGLIFCVQDDGLLII